MRALRLDCARHGCVACDYTGAESAWRLCASARHEREQHISSAKANLIGNSVRSTPRARNGKPARDRAAWIAEARTVLVAGGIAAVKVGKLAAKLGVTRESFYHHFKSLQELQQELLNDWERGNAAAYENLLDPAHDSEQEFQAMERMWLEEAAYSPVWDSAIRDWARVSKKAARVIARVDERRVGMIKQMFLDMGYEEVEALVRARIYYFHQVGYYTIRPGESREERLRLLPVYLRVLKGHP